MARSSPSTAPCASGARRRSRSSRGTGAPFADEGGAVNWTLSSCRERGAASFRTGVERADSGEQRRFRRRCEGNTIELSVLTRLTSVAHSFRRFGQGEWVGWIEEGEGFLLGHFSSSLEGVDTVMGTPLAGSWGGCGSFLLHTWVRARPPGAGRGVEWGKGAWVEKMTDDRDGGVFAWRKAKNESYE